MSKVSKRVPRGKSEIQLEKNKKVDEGLDENILFSDDEICEIDEDNTVVATNTVDELGIKQDGVEINHFFNELPIRIVNSHQFPFFYAEDISKVLGIKRVKASIANFTEKEIVSPELRRKYNITTYQKYRTGVRRNDKIILLTEFGVYRLLMNSRSQLADKFRDFVYDVLYQLRTAGEYKIKAELEQLRVTSEQQQKEIVSLKAKQQQFKNLCDELVLIEYPNNPYEILPTNVPGKLLKKSAKTKINPRKNSIDDPVPHAIRLAQQLNLTDELNLVPVDTDTPTTHWQHIHDQNITRAREFIDQHSPRNAYMVTSNPTAETLTEANVLHRVYVKNSNRALKSLAEKLADARPERTSSRAHYYSCDKEKIITALDAIAD
jgi:prophage antirepressor-like protein